MPPDLDTKEAMLLLLWMLFLRSGLIRQWLSIYAAKSLALEAMLLETLFRRDQFGEV
jgi:hypothetical protein